MHKLDLKALYHCQAIEELDLSHNRLTSIDLKPLWHCRELQTLWLAGNRLTQVELSPLWHATGLRSINLKENELTRLDISPILKSQSDFKFFIDSKVQLVAEKRLQSALWKHTTTSFQERISQIEWYDPATPEQTESPTIITKPHPEILTPDSTDIVDLDALGQEFITHCIAKGWLVARVTPAGVKYELTTTGEIALKGIGLNPFKNEL